MATYFETGDGQEKLEKAKKGDRVGPERAVDGEERGAHGAVFRLRGAEVSEAKPTGTSLEEVVGLPSGVEKEELEKPEKAERRPSGTRTCGRL